MLGVDVGLRSPHKQKHLLKSEKKTLCNDVVKLLQSNLLSLLAVYL